MENETREKGAINITSEQKYSVIRLRGQGAGYAEIGRELGISAETVKSFCRRNDLLISGSKVNEVTVTDCFKGKLICAHCGNTYHRTFSCDRWVYWFCMGKRKKGVECHSLNYADFQLRRISASMLGIDNFSDSVFEQNIEKIVVLEDGSLEYHFYNGRVETWKRI